MVLEWIAGLLAALGGAMAVVAGFGIGSVLTPALTPSTGAKLAVALVVFPHFVGTALRFWRLRRHVDAPIMKRFGVLSAIGGLAGALVHALIGSAAIGIIFGVLIAIAGIGGLTGLADRVRFRGRSAWAAGLVSGLFGGLSGTQGGIRSAALMGFDLSRDAFIATSTAVALAVDVVRAPIYVVASAPGLMERRALLPGMIVGVVLGTLAGERVLRRIPERIFRRVVSALILGLGISMLVLPEG